MREIERIVLLNNVDRHWMDHIDAMDQLRQGIGLRAYGQHDPIVEYKVEGYNMFEEMVQGIHEDTLRGLFHVKLRQSAPQRVQVARETKAQAPSDSGEQKRPARKTANEKIGRNDPCPCGSGKKYKNCCGKMVN